MTTNRNFCSGLFSFRLYDLAANWIICAESGLKSAASDRFNLSGVLFWWVWFKPPADKQQKCFVWWVWWWGCHQLMFTCHTSASNTDITKKRQHAEFSAARIFMLSCCSAELWICWWHREELWHKQHFPVTDAWFDKTTFRRPETEQQPACSCLLTKLKTL